MQGEDFRQKIKRASIGLLATQPYSIVASRKAPTVRAANWYKQSDAAEVADPFAAAGTAGSRLAGRSGGESGDFSFCGFITSLLRTPGRMAYITYRCSLTRFCIMKFRSFDEKPAKFFLVTAVIPSPWSFAWRLPRNREV
jgi:hypothetical protein